MSEEVKCPKEQHCFHWDNVALTSMPMQYREVCCHCGKVKYRTDVARWGVGEHGKYFNM